MQLYAYINAIVSQIMLLHAVRCRMIMPVMQLCSGKFSFAGTLASVAWQYLGRTKEFSACTDLDV